MKKFIVAILSLLYLGTTSGATVHLHYCMGELVEWALVNNNDNTCDKCGMEKVKNDDNGCCKDESKQVKIEDDQKVAVSDFKWFNQFATSPHVHPLFDEAEYSVTNKKTTTNSHAPPVRQAVPLNIRFCCFLI